MNFNIPAYPHLRRFSDPYVDFEGEEEKLVRIAAKAPASLDYMEMLTIFNPWLPAGGFEEMAPYIPTALNFILRNADDNDSEAGMLLEHLITWCYKERTALEQHPDFQLGMQQAIMSFFHLWASQTAWRKNEQMEAGAELRHAYLMKVLLNQGDECSAIEQKVDRQFGHAPRPAIPWLRATHFLPLLMELDSIPHAAWLLHHFDGDVIFKRPRYSVPLGIILKAIDMVEEWLLSAHATEADIAIWDPIVTSHRMQLHYFPHPR